MHNKNSIQTAYISFGGNIQPKMHFRNAIKKMKEDFSGFVCSSVYESKSVGFEGDNFLNLVVKIETDITIRQLYEYLHQLEECEGRERLNGKTWDSRTLDLDILLFGDYFGSHGGIELPRSEITEHSHVLTPLAEIAGNLVHQPSGKSYQQLLEGSNFKGQEIWKVEI